ncbi:MAG: zinc-dependent alcohol dehydrogenase [Carbonactinosporaceae bacterium]
MRAAVVEAARTVVVRDVGEPVPDGRAIVELSHGGLCGTDLKIVAGAIPVALPRVLGHELVGTVIEPGHAGLVEPGSRVLVDPGVACGHCVLCLADRGHLCRNGALLGRDVDGGFAQRLAVDERQLHVLPDRIGDKEAPVLQVLSTCVHAQTLVDVFPGQVAVVVGLGVSGLLHLQLLLSRGVGTVIGVSRSPGKLRLARTLGAAAAVTPDEARAAVTDITAGHGADLVVECVGTVSTFGHAVELAGMGSTVLLFGTITDRQGELPFYQLYFKELDVRSSRAARPRDYARAIQLAASGAVRTAELVTSSFPLSEIAAALAACEHDPSQLKVTLDISS